ncbi:hypothetical protein D3C83_215000 [compost metagenome]
MEILDPQPASTCDEDCRIEPLKVPRVRTTFTEDDLVIRQFLPTSSRQLVRKGASRAA